MDYDKAAPVMVDRVGGDGACGPRPIGPKFNNATSTPRTRRRRTRSSLARIGTKGGS
jgi:hypothetical protein